MRVLRIARGVLGTALTWSIPWAIAGALLRIVFRLESPSFPSLSMLYWSAIGAGVAGALIGSVFAIILALGGSTLFARLSYRRIAVLGAIVPVAVSGAVAVGEWSRMSSELAGYFLWQTAILAALSAGCAYATLWVFRRAPEDAFARTLGAGATPKYSPTTPSGETVTR